MIRGLDVASPQGAISPAHWQALAARGIRFVYAKCGDGNGAPDPTFAANAKNAHDVGLVVGAYHVGFPLPVDPAHPGREPDVQARAHFAQSGGLGFGGGELPPALDLEWPVPGSDEWRAYGCTPLSARTWALAYLAEMSKLAGRPCVLYDGFPDYWRGILGASEPAFANYPAWIVDYPAPYAHGYPPDTSLLVVPKPWTVATLWQMNGGGLVLPSGAPADSDVFVGDEASFRAFLTKPTMLAAAGANDPEPPPSAA